MRINCGSATKGQVMSDVNSAPYVANFARHTECHDGQRLISLLHRDANTTFQTLDDSGMGKLVPTMMHGKFEKCRERLEDLNEKGAGVFFMVNLGDCEGRKAANVVEVIAVFADLDGAPLEPVNECNLKPHVIVESSPGRYHAYWLVLGMQREQFKEFQTAIAHRFNGDKRVNDLPRLMRLPGFKHNKNGAVDCRIIHFDDSAPAYSMEELVSGLELEFVSERNTNTFKPSLATKEDKIPTGVRNNTLFQLARGFVNKGFTQDDIRTRIDKINSERCLPPLDASEVRKLVESACSHGARGYLQLPLCIVDSDEFRGLSHPARTIALAAYRRVTSSNNGNVSLPHSDFKMQFTRSQSFYRARKELMDIGLLRVTRQRKYNSRGGREPDLFEVLMTPPSVPNLER